MTPVMRGITIKKISKLTKITTDRSSKVNRTRRKLTSQSLSTKTKSLMKEIYQGPLFLHLQMNTNTSSK